MTKFHDILKDIQLLDTPIFSPSEYKFNATLNAHGEYHPMHYVMRLSPRVHAALEAIRGINTMNLKDANQDTITAFSTYLHETIHWWQFSGSTTGFILSMSYPAQTHANFGLLNFLLKNNIKKKSILQIIETPKIFDDKLASLCNIIYNNLMDIEFFRAISIRNKFAQSAIESPIFESLGHSYMITYHNILVMLDNTFPSLLDKIPNPRKLEAASRIPKEKKVENYYYGSTLVLPEVDVTEIFEGQARFAQLQYLDLCSEEPLTLATAKERGMFSSDYIKAFEVFLTITNFEVPKLIDDPTIGLFLILCDFAINPTEGFPFTPSEYSTFIRDTSAGFRFQNLCLAVRKNPSLRGKIKNYDKKEYLEVMADLSLHSGLKNPVEIGKRMAEIVKEAIDVENLMNVEHKTFKFQGLNMPLRVLFSHFISFQLDKIESPHFFCWPGRHMVGDFEQSLVDLFLKNTPIFVDREFDNGVFPRIHHDKIEKDVHTAFSSFYSGVVRYDFTRQWIMQPGEFKYNFGWLSDNFNTEQFRRDVDLTFHATYGIFPTDLEILK